MDLDHTPAQLIVIAELMVARGLGRLLVEWFARWPREWRAAAARA
jgi:hypothetical protein